MRKNKTAYHAEPVSASAAISLLCGFTELLAIDPDPESFRGRMTQEYDYNHF